MPLWIEPYDLLLFVAVHAGVLLTERRLRRDGESLLERPWVLLAVLAAALVGGRVHFLVEAVLRGTVSGDEIVAYLSPLRGGSTFFGAMAGLFLALYALRSRLPYRSVLRLADAGVAGLGVAIAIGRLGCLVNGCCLGMPTDRPWAVPIGAHAADPDVAAALAAMQREAGAGVGLHPLVVYLGLWALASAWLATRPELSRRLGGVPGTRILAFGALFCAGRFVIEAWRLPPVGVAHGVHPGRWEALLLAIGLGATLLVRARRAVRDPRA